MSGPVEPEHDDLAAVRSYVDDYIAGRGRDSAEHEQFAANHAQEIEEEFGRRLAAQQFTSQDQPESSYFDAPPLEPDGYEPDRDQPEPDLDWEMGD